MKHVGTYKEQHKKPFKIYGEPIIHIINNQWALYKENKEQEKKAKKSARDCQLEVESKMRSQLKA